MKIEEKAGAETRARRAANPFAGWSLGLLASVPILLLVVTGGPGFRGADLVAAQIVRGEPIVPTAAPRGTPIDSPATNANAPAKKPAQLSPAITEALAAMGKGHSTNDYLPVGFDKLSAFKIEVTDDMFDGTKNLSIASAKTAAKIPFTVKAYDGRKVALQGFILPTKVKKGLVTEFLLLKNQMLCCYGVTPQINEWVEVHTGGMDVKDLIDKVTTVSGKFHVGELRQEGFLSAIYTLDADKVEVAPAE